MKHLSFKRIHFNLIVALWFAVVVILGLSLWAFKGAFGVLEKARTEDETIQATRSVRVNFESFDLAIKRIEGAPVFVPGDVSERNPFLATPKKGE